ncbi:MAG: cupredoxin family copper-binding protein [Caulobacteraceae bacterium]|nr:cupredoxin family copper-binding protein [Caulobacteraceae bacterium]
MKTIPFRACVIAANLVLTGVGLVAAADAAGPPDAVQVTIKNFDFHPMAVTVPIGGSVTWKNLDGEPHTVTSTDGSFRSQALDEDDSYTVKFAKPGVYSYLCTIHPRMRARVTVK